MAFGDIELAFADHVHRFDAPNERASAAKCLEPQHGSHDSFERPMILLDDVIEVFDLAHLDLRTGVGTNAFNGRRVGSVAISQRW